jgi:hypothetical protein
LGFVGWLLLLLHDLEGLSDPPPCFLELLEFGQDENGQETNSGIHEILEFFRRGDADIVSTRHVDESLDDPGDSHHGKSGNVANNVKEVRDERITRRFMCVRKRRQQP